MTHEEPGVGHDEAERADILHEMQRHSPEGVEADKATVRRELRLIIPLTIIGLIGTGVALHCIGGWLAVGLGAVVFIGYYVYGWGAGLLAALVRRRERTHMLEQVDEHIEAEHRTPRE
jgi:NhaP-type Na+/H+ or K+/H+ antiporter